MSWLLLQNHLSAWISMAELPATLATADLWLAHGLGLVAIILGLVLWLMGRRLARPACTMLWVILGVLVTGAICRVAGDAGLLPLWLIAGGIIAGALGWMLYRICLALVLCVFLALAAPAGLYLAQHGLGGTAEALHSATQAMSDTQGDPASTQSAREDSADQITQSVKDKTAQATQAVKDTVNEAKEKVKDVVNQAVAQAAEAAGHLLDKADAPSRDSDEKKPESAQATTTSKKQAESETDHDSESAVTPLQVPPVSWWLQTTRTLAQGPWDRLSAWWSGLADGPRRTMLLASALGAVCGFLLGLIFPKIGATTGSSLLGTLFMAAGAVLILSFDHPQTLDDLSNHPPVCVLILGLITLLGVIIQWTFLRRRADN